LIGGFTDENIQEIRLILFKLNSLWDIKGMDEKKIEVSLYYL
jgi:hypothetical protein